MNKKHFIIIGIAVMIFVAVLTIVIIWRIEPVSQNQNAKSLSVNSEEEAGQLLQINRAALAAVPVGELPPLGDYDIVVGNAKAKVKVIVYENLNDIYSAQLNKSLQELKNVYGDDVAFIYRPFVFAGDDTGLLTAQAVLCAAEQKKFGPLRDLLLTKVSDGSSNSLDARAINDYAAGLDINKDKFSACLSDAGRLAGIKDGIKQVANSVVFGSPTTFVNGELVVGARDFADSVSSAGEKLEGLKSIVARHLQ